MDSALSVVSKVRALKRFKSGETIFHSGGTPLGLYTVQSGLVKIESLSNEGLAHTLRLLGSGSILGYRSLFAGENYRASALAVEDCELCFIPRHDLFEIFKNSPQVALNIVSHISKDLGRAEEKWVTQIDREAPERVAEALLFLNDHFQDQTWTRREIAEWAGTTPETVMRTLSQFEKDGWIDLLGRRIQIRSREKLKEKAQGA